MISFKWIFNGFEQPYIVRTDDEGNISPSYSFALSEPTIENCNDEQKAFQKVILQSTNQHIYEINNKTFDFDKVNRQFNIENKNNIEWMFGPLKEYIDKIERSIEWSAHGNNEGDSIVTIEIKMLLSPDMYSYVQKMTEDFASFKIQLKTASELIECKSTQYKPLETEQVQSFIRPIILDENNFLYEWTDDLRCQRTRNDESEKYNLPEQWSFDKQSSTKLFRYVIPCLKKLRNVEPCIYRLIVLSNKLKYHIRHFNSDLTGLKIYSNLFVSFVYELLKPNSDVRFKDERNNIFYIVEDMKKIYNSQIDGPYKRGDRQYFIFDYFDYCKHTSSTNNTYNKYLERVFDKFVNKYCRSNRNKTFHVTLDEINNKYDDENNFIYSFMVNNDDIPVIERTNKLINFVDQLTDFCIECFLYCWEFIHIAFKSYNAPSSEVKEDELREYRYKNN